MIAFGPVPSRRLGCSFGVNNIPPKHCSYSCVYCQVGPTTPLQVERRTFYAPGAVVEAVARGVEECRAAGVEIDYITFVPDGEPTLDVNIGAEIRALKLLDLPVAVITNASLLWLPEVRADLAAANLVSLKLDATRPEVWRRINRPHGRLDFDRVLAGIREFVARYDGDLLTESMLVDGINSDAACVEELTAFLTEVEPCRAYLAVPTRPPADTRVRPPNEQTVLQAYQIMSERLPLELLVSAEQGPFGGTGGGMEDLLAMLAVHPMREEAVDRYLAEIGMDRVLLEDLIRVGRLTRVEYRGEVFYVRRFEIEG